MYWQHDPRWNNHKLGDGPDSIGADGCLITCMAELVAGHVKMGYTPLNMNSDLMAHGGFVQGELVANDNMLHVLFPDFFGPSRVFKYESGPADLSKLDYKDGFVIIEVDFDHNLGNGIQTHFLLLQGYNPATQGITIGDPWYGSVDAFSKHYGTDKTKTIIKIVQIPFVYKQPAQVVTTPSQPSPEPVSAPPAADPTPAPLPPVAPPQQPETSPSTIPLEPSNPVTLPAEVPIMDGMKNLFNDLYVRFTSRKFLLAVGGALTMVNQHQYAAAAAVLLGYFGVNVLDNSTK